jgi:Trehalase-like, N-terminal
VVAPQSASALAADTADPIRLPERGPGTAGGSGYLPVSEHGLIGDMRSVALVGNNGSIDWYYWPSFDSPAVFGKLLDAVLRAGRADATGGRLGETGAALAGLSQPLFGVFGQKIAERDAAACGLGREPLGKVAGKDDGAVHAVVALPALVAEFRHVLPFPAPALQRR